MTKITTPFSGGCACGAIRYESTAEPVMMLHCHCRDCQQSSGGPFSSFVIVPTEAFKLLQGSLRFHASPSEMGGKTRRGFCPECSSPIYGKPDLIPHIIAIRTASLDDPNWFNPQADVWTSDAHPWDQMDPALPKFEKYPPSGD
ncbi:MAG: Gfa-like protein [Pedosphaera sp.]|nr:Gfa-like protein [Pedosphaera sp.]